MAERLVWDQEVVRSTRTVLIGQAKSNKMASRLVDGYTPTNNLMTEEEYED